MSSLNTRPNQGLPALLLFWLLFFLISLGIGYPVLNRFDPRLVPGCIDSIAYFKMAAGESATNTGEQLRLRPLVPWIANPIYRLSKGRIGTWNPVALGLLVSSSLFVATAGLLLLLLGKKSGISDGVALSGTLLFLLNFAVHNKQLGCGLVDAGESSLMLALFWLLLERRHCLLPLVGMLGALSKETFLPMCIAATGGWAICELRQDRWKWRETLWAAGMIVVGFCAMVVLQYDVYGTLQWPWEFAASLGNSGVSMLQGLINGLLSHQFWYVFVWLLPLGVFRLKEFPKAWLDASICGAASAMAMGAWNNGEGTEASAIFHSIGPILALSTACFLVSPRRREM